MFACYALRQASIGRRRVRKVDGESRRKLLRWKDVRTLEVPIFPDHDGDPTLQLTYTDSGKLDDRPTLVVIPGDPGFASVVPYDFYRSRIARAGFRVVMVEHRGVGLSRHDAKGEDLPVKAMRAQYAARDVLAVLDHLSIEKAWLHGTSYGGYLAQLVGVLAHERAAGMFLDTTMYSSEDGEAQREYNRKLFVRGRVAGDGEDSRASTGTSRLRQGHRQGAYRGRFASL